MSVRMGLGLSIGIAICLSGINAGAYADPLFNSVRRQVNRLVVDRVKDDLRKDAAVGAEVERLRSQLPKTLSDKVLQSVEFSEAENLVTLRYWMALPPEEKNLMLDSGALATAMEAVKCSWLGTDNLFDTVRDFGFQMELVYSIYGASQDAATRISFENCTKPQ